MVEKTNSFTELLIRFIEMKKLSLIIFLLSIMSPSAKAQKAKIDSVHKKNSAGIEFTCAPHFISELGNGYPIFPEFELQYERKICPKTFLSIGVVYPYEYDDYWHSYSFEYELPNSFNKGDVKIRVGLDYKMKLFKQFYFAPSLDFYWIREHFRSFHNPHIDEFTLRKVISAGPDLQFEYRTKRISIQTSLLAFSYGLEFPFNTWTKKYSVWSQNDISRLHKVFSLGFHYNF